MKRKGFLNLVLLMLILGFVMLMTGCDPVVETVEIEISSTAGGHVEWKDNDTWNIVEGKQDVEPGPAIDFRAVAEAEFLFDGWEITGADYGVADNLEDKEIKVQNFTEGATIKATFVEDIELPIDLSVEEVGTVELGETFDLNITVDPADATLNIAYDEDYLEKINDLQFSALQVGETEITVTAEKEGYLSAEETITVVIEEPEDPELTSFAVVEEEIPDLQDVQARFKGLDQFGNEIPITEENMEDINVEVEINGLPQLENTEYSYEKGDPFVTLLEAPTAGDKVEIIFSGDIDQTLTYTVVEAEDPVPTTLELEYDDELDYFIDDPIEFSVTVKDQYEFPYTVDPGGIRWRIDGTIEISDGDVVEELTFTEEGEFEVEAILKEDATLRDSVMVQILPDPQYTVTFIERNEVAGVNISIFSDPDREEQVGDEITTGAEGIATKQLEDGDYWFTASRDEYLDEEGAFSIDGADKEIEFTMLDFVETFDVSNADELYDALASQMDYEMIRFIDDIDEDVDFDIELKKDGLIFNLNGYNLVMDSAQDFIVDASDIIIRGSTIEIPSGDFKADTGGSINLTFDGVTFKLLDGDFKIIADYEGASSEVNIFNSVFIIHGRFEYDLDENDTTGEINISNSTFDLTGKFEIDADSDGVRLTVNIDKSEFIIDDDRFEIDADHSGLIMADITITNTAFDLDSGRIDIDVRRAKDYSVILRDLTFISLDEIRIEGDMELNGAIVKEEAGEFKLTGYDFDDFTFTLKGEIILEHEDNLMTLDADGQQLQIRGDAVFKGDGLVNFSTGPGGKLEIFDLTFTNPVDINDGIHLIDVTLGETTLSSSFTISRTVTLTAQMTLQGNYEILADRPPLPLDNDLTIRGTLLGSEDAVIDGDGFFLVLGDELKVENITFQDVTLFLDTLSTVVFKDVILGEDTSNLQLYEETKLHLKGDLILSEDLEILFTDAGLIAGHGHSIVPLDESVKELTFKHLTIGGKVKDLTFELDVLSRARHIIYEEVTFAQGIYFAEEDGKIIGGGWSPEDYLVVYECQVTFEKGIEPVNNAGDLIALEDGEIFFETDMETDLQYPLGISDHLFPEELERDASGLEFDMSFTLEKFGLADKGQLIINLGQALELMPMGFEIHKDGEELSPDIATISVTDTGSIGATDAILTVTAHGDDADKIMFPGTYQIVHYDIGVNEGIAQTAPTSQTETGLIEMATSLIYEFDYKIAFDNATTVFQLLGPDIIGRGTHGNYMAEIHDADGERVEEGVIVTFEVTSEDDPELTGLDSVAKREVATDMNGEAHFDIYIKGDATIGWEYTLKASIDEGDDNVDQSDYEEIIITVGP